MRRDHKIAEQEHARRMMEEKVRLGVAHELRGVACHLAAWNPDACDDVAHCFSSRVALRRLKRSSCRVAPLLHLMTSVCAKALPAALEGRVEHCQAHGVFCHPKAS